MLTILLVLAALAGNVLSTGPSRCDDKVVKQIKASWNGNVPVDLIKTAIANEKEIVVGTTAGYYSADVTGAFSNFIQEKSNPLTHVLANKVLKNGKRQVSSFYVKEESGSTYDPDSKIRRYHLYQDVKGGVTGLYACIESPDAKVGPPAGIVKIRASQYDKDSVTKANTELKKYGIVISKTLSYNPL